MWYFTKRDGGRFRPWGFEKPLFYPGDKVVNKWEKNAPELLVLLSPYENDTMLVRCPRRGVIKVLAWGCKKIDNGS